MAGSNRARRIVTGGGIAAVLALCAIPALAVPPGPNPNVNPPPSNPTPPTDPPPPGTTPGEAPTISGTPQRGRPLTLSLGTWGPGADYQWIRCGSAPNSCAYILLTANMPTYTLQAADVGATIKVRLRREGAAPGNFTEVDTNSTPVITNPPPPPPPPTPKPAPPALTPPKLVQRPRISGRIRQGSVIQGTAGRWTGTQPIGFVYRWRRCDETGCRGIADATRPSYRLTDADVGARVVLAVTADNRARGTASATSLPTAPVTPTRTRRVRARVTIGGRVTVSGVKLTAFRVRAERGARISIHCRGRRCPVKRLSTLASKGSFSVKRLRRRVLPGGTLIAVRVTKLFRIGKYTRLRVRTGRLPIRRDRCLRPGSDKPSRCRR